jgi:hypothetical protein
MTNVNSQLHQHIFKNNVQEHIMVKENITEQFTTSHKEGILTYTGNLVLLG